MSEIGEIWIVIEKTIDGIQKLVLCVEQNVNDIKELKTMKMKIMALENNQNLLLKKLNEAKKNE